MESSQENIREIYEQNKADYMMGNPLDDDFMEEYSQKIASMSKDEREEYFELSRNDSSDDPMI